jgi:D-cysteine desulfhydrase
VAGRAEDAGGPPPLLTTHRVAPTRPDPHVLREASPDGGRLAAVLALHDGRRGPLFERFPALEGRLPWLPLLEGPTPVEAMTGAPGGAALWVKRDDLTSPLYGGNKVRKLEHVLADALLRRARTLITLGGYGSNQALALALHGRRLDLAVELALAPQPVTEAVRRTARGAVAAGARVHVAGSAPGALVKLLGAALRLRLGGGRPYLVPAGASSALGTLGYVGAALELATQVRAGVLPEPERIFVALGTGGTAAGLALGLALAGLRTRVTAVRVYDAWMANGAVVRHRARRALALLRALDPSVPAVRLAGDALFVAGGYLGRGYGAPTAAGRAAAAWSPLPLDLTYTAKAMAACLDHCRAGARGPVLFWHTLSASMGPGPRPDGPVEPASLRAALATLDRSADD